MYPSTLRVRVSGGTISNYLTLVKGGLMLATNLRYNLGDSRSVGRVN